MEPQKEERTPGEPVGRPLGALRSQPLNEEERLEDGAAPPAAVLGEEAEGASADGLWELPVETPERRPECSRCR